MINLDPKLNGKNAAKKYAFPEEEKKREEKHQYLPLQIHFVSHCNYVMNATAISLLFLMDGTLDKLAIPILKSDQRPN